MRRHTLLVFLALIGLLLYVACAGTDDNDQSRQRNPTPTPEADDDNDAGSPTDDDDVASPYPRCPGREDMILIPAGEFTFRYEGTRYEEEGLDSKLVDLDEFCIDEFEYPNIAGLFPLPVSWDESVQVCAALGKRLCSGEEWQKACTGPQEDLYPWGGEFDDSVCNTHRENWTPRELAPSGSWPECISGYGVFDMSGNVSEWTDEVWQEGWQDMSLRGGGYNVNPANNQEKQDDGFWQFTAYSQKCSSIHHHPPTSVLTDDGMRCCAEPQ